MIVRAFIAAGLFALTAAAAHAQDAAAGDRVFNRCRPCHQIGPGARNLVGPELNGLIGRQSGSIPSYPYSPAMKDVGLTWDETTFIDYIKNPKARVPGTKMIFAGLGREQDIADLVAYLKQFKSDGAKQ